MKTTFFSTQDGERISHCLPDRLQAMPLTHVCPRQTSGHPLSFIFKSNRDGGPGEKMVQVLGDQ